MLLAAWIFQTLGFYGSCLGADAAWPNTLQPGYPPHLLRADSPGAVPGALAGWPISDRFHRKAPAVIVAVLIAAVRISYGLSFNAVAIVAFGFAVSVPHSDLRRIALTPTPRSCTRPRSATPAAAWPTASGDWRTSSARCWVAAIYSHAGYVWVFVLHRRLLAAVAAAIAILGPRSGQAPRGVRALTAVAGGARRSAAASHLTQLPMSVACLVD